MKVLLRIPEIVAAVQPLIDKSVDGQILFELIGAGHILPLGYIHRMPVFSVEQIADVVAAIRQFGSPLNNPSDIVA